MVVALMAGLVLTASAMSESEADFASFVKRQQLRMDAKKTEGMGIAGTPPDDGSSSPSPSTPTCIRTVGMEGSGAQYQNVQDAIDSIPESNEERCVIRIGEGSFWGKNIVTAKQRYITFEGAGMFKTFLKYNDYAEKAGSTSKSASTAVMSDYFVAKDLTFENTHPPPPGGAVGQQAVAFRIEGDFAQFYRVGFLGAQDTLYDKKGRHYFKDCYIKGSIDFVFGNGQSYYEYCHLDSIANPGSGSLTAQKKMTKDENSGFSFVNCKVTGNGPIYLGRAWGPYSRVVLLLTDISAPIIPAGWYNWGDSSREKKVYYGQYKCTGVGANTEGRVNWSKDLTDEEAAPFLTWDFVDGHDWITPM